MKDLSIMEAIQNEKAKSIAAAGQPSMNAATITISAGKRFTIDIIDAPTDPLR